MTLKATSTSAKTLLTTLIVVLISSVSICQVIDLNRFDSVNQLSITPEVSILRTTDSLALKDILKSTTQFFLADNEPVLVYNYDPYYYWLRFILRNTDQTDNNVMLIMAPVGMREGKLYQKQKDSFQLLHRTGIKFSFRDRPYPFMHNVFPVTIPAGKTDTLYLYVDATGSNKTFGFSMMKPKDLKIFESRTYFVFGIIVGLLALFCIFNISLYFVLKVKTNLWYALYIGFLFLIVMKNDHLDQQFLGWDSEKMYQLTPYMAIGAIGLAILSHVVQQFLQPVIPKGSQLYEIFYYIKINALLGGLCHYFFFFYKLDYVALTTAFNWAKYSALLASAGIIAACVYAIYKKFYGAYFILFGLVVFLIGACQRLFYPNTQSFLFPPTTLHLGIILETLIITLGLVYQYYWLEKAMKRKREDEFKQELHKTELDIQQQTMRNISLEIHDNVGQLLSLAKLNLMTMDCNGHVQLKGRILDCTNLVATAIQDLRHLARAMNNDFSNELTLTSLIQRELAQIEKIGVHKVQFEEVGDAFEPRHRQFLFRIFQECINNIVKHADASLIQVGLYYDHDTFTMIISDNGRGFDADLLTSDENIGMGIKNMKERAHMIGGDLRIISEPGKGTQILSSLSVREPTAVM